MTDAPFGKPPSMETPHGFIGKRDGQGLVPGLDLVNDQLIEPVPEFVEFIKQENDFNEGLVLAGKGIDGPPALLLQTLDPPMDLLKAAIGAFAP